MIHSSNLVSNIADKWARFLRRVQKMKGTNNWPGGRIFLGSWCSLSIPQGKFLNRPPVRPQPLRPTSFPIH